MGANPFLGLIYHWIGGFASATNFIPFRQIRRWSWEVYWIIQGFAAWIVAPIVLATIPVSLVAFKLRRYVKATFDMPLVVACGWTVTAGLLWYGQRLGSR